MGLPWWLCGKESACQYRRRGFGYRRWGFGPRSGKIPRAVEPQSSCAAGAEPAPRNQELRALRRPCAAGGAAPVRCLRASNGGAAPGASAPGKPVQRETSTARSRIKWGGGLDVTDARRGLGWGVQRWLARHPFRVCEAAPESAEPWIARPGQEDSPAQARPGPWRLQEKQTPRKGALEPDARLLPAHPGARLRPWRLAQHRRLPRLPARTSLLTCPLLRPWSADCLTALVVLLLKSPRVSFSRSHRHNHMSQ